MEVKGKGNLSWLVMGVGEGFSVNTAWATLSCHSKYFKFSSLWSFMRHQKWTLSYANLSRPLNLLDLTKNSSPFSETLYILI